MAETPDTVFKSACCQNATGFATRQRVSPRATAWVCPIRLNRRYAQVESRASDGHSRETALPRTVTFQAAAVLMLWCAVRALTADAWATPLERVEFESASQRLGSGGLIRGDRIQGDLAKPDGAGPFPAVIGLHGCAGMHDTTKQKLADELVGWGYVVLLVDSFATRGIDHACTSGGFINFSNRRQDAYGALVFAAGQTFVDPHRVAAVGFSQGAWVTLSVAEPNSFEQLVPPGSDLRF